MEAQKSTLVFNSAAQNKNFVFAAMAHKTQRSDTYFNRISNQLVVVEESSLTSYALSESVLTLAPINPFYSYYFIKIRAESKLEHDPLSS